MPSPQRAGAENYPFGEDSRQRPSRSTTRPSLASLSRCARTLRAAIGARRGSRSTYTAATSSSTVAARARSSAARTCRFALAAMCQVLVQLGRRVGHDRTRGPGRSCAAPAPAGAPATPCSRPSAPGWSSTMTVPAPSHQIAREQRALGAIPEAQALARMAGRGQRLQPVEERLFVGQARSTPGRSAWPSSGAPVRSHTGARRADDRRGDA